MAKEKGRFRAFLRDKGKPLLVALTNPRFLLCFGLAWMITNGWSYILFAVGTLLGIHWMTAVAGAYLAFLWIPFTPEKIITAAIAIALLRWLFPNDQRTLAVLKHWREKLINAVRKKREERKEKNQ